MFSVNSSIFRFFFVSIMPNFLSHFRLIFVLNLTKKPKLDKITQNYEGYAQGMRDYHTHDISNAIVPESDENEEEPEPEDYDGDRCTDDQFTCKNSVCIAIDQRCDGRRNCADGSDELDCTFNRRSGE